MRRLLGLMMVLLLSLVIVSCQTEDSNPLRLKSVEIVPQGETVSRSLATTSRPINRPTPMELVASELVNITTLEEIKSSLDIEEFGIIQPNHGAFIKNAPYVDVVLYFEGMRYQKGNELDWVTVNNIALELLDSEGEVLVAQSFQSANFADVNTTEEIVVVRLKTHTDVGTSKKSFDDGNYSIRMEAVQYTKGSQNYLTVLEEESKITDFKFIGTDVKPEVVLNKVEITSVDFDVVTNHRGGFQEEDAVVSVLIQREDGKRFVLEPVEGNNYLVTGLNIEEKIRILVVIEYETFVQNDYTYTYKRTVEVYRFDVVTYNPVYWDDIQSVRNLDNGTFTITVPMNNADEYELTIDKVLRDNNYIPEELLKVVYLENSTSKTFRFSLEGLIPAGLSGLYFYEVHLKLNGQDFKIFDFNSSVLT